MNTEYPGHLDTDLNQQRGKLTIFLGMSTGVGKTCSMLQAAREQIAEGIEVTVGLVETHGHQNPENLLKGMEQIPPRRIEYNGIIVEEMDLDAILQRHPQIVLIDELAHKNIQAVRHQYRYLDIEELLESGTDVYTTLNIQNVESLNDTVLQITGNHITETVPDRFLDTADQIKLIDIPAEELIRRFNAGKIYAAGEIEPGLRSFFQPETINALRELALHYTSQRVEQQSEKYRNQSSINQPPPVLEKVMACISSSPFAVHVLRQARQIADEMKAEFYVVYVEPPFSKLSAQSLSNLRANLQLAEDLGAKVITLNSQNVSAGVLNLARKLNISQIILGKPLRPRWRDITHGSVVDDIIRGASGIGVFVIPGSPVPLESEALVTEETFTHRHTGRSWVLTLFMTAVVTLLGSLYGNYLGFTNLGMMYLLPVVYTSARIGTIPSIIIALVNVFLLDVFFIPPILNLTVYDIRHLITFAVFMIVAFTTGNIADRLRLRMKEAIYRETRIRALYDLARSLSAVSDLKLLGTEVVRHISNTMDAEVVLYLSDSNSSPSIVAASKAFSDLVQGPNEMNAAEWSFRHSQRSGLGTNTIPGAKGFYIPVKTEEKVFGVLGVKPVKEFFTAEQINILEALAGLTALAVARLELAAETQRISSLEDSERLRAALLNSVSHDMKTPLASILGAVTSLVDEDDLYDADQKATLLLSIRRGALRMTRLINNLLNLARLESGYMSLHSDWCDIQDIIGVALRENQDLLQEHQVRVETADKIGLIKADYGLIEQVLTNLLHNAVKYSPVQSDIVISVVEEQSELKVSVIDNGMGIAPGDAEKIFEKFYRLQSPQNVSGTGLGLSICRGIIEAHGGRIWAQNRPDGGSEFIFTLPVDKTARSGEMDAKVV